MALSSRPEVIRYIWVNGFIMSEDLLLSRGRIESLPSKNMTNTAVYKLLEKHRQVPQNTQIKEVKVFTEHLRFELELEDRLMVFQPREKGDKE